MNHLECKTAINISVSFSLLDHPSGWAEKMCHFAVSANTSEKNNTCLKYVGLPVSKTVSHVGSSVISKINMDVGW